MKRRKATTKRAKMTTLIQHKSVFANLLNFAAKIFSIVD